MPATSPEYPFRLAEYGRSPAARFLPQDLVDRRTPRAGKSGPLVPSMKVIETRFTDGDDSIVSECVLNPVKIAIRGVRVNTGSGPNVVVGIR